jgi:hypothetical protein
LDTGPRLDQLLFNNDERITVSPIEVFYQTQNKGAAGYSDGNLR